MKCNKRVGSIAFLLLVLFTLGAIFFKIHRVVDSHMASTLVSGDRLLCSTQTRNIVTNDLIVYHDPSLYDLKLRKKPVRSSRVMGTPGDQLQIINKEVLVNNQWLKAPATARRAYRVITEGVPIDSAFLNDFNLEDPVVIARDAGIYDVFLDTLAYQALVKIPGIVNVRSMQLFEKDPSSEYWPFSGFYSWNRDHVGPLTVPAAGQKVQISLDNIDQYRDIIENHEGHQIIADFRGVRIDGHPVHSYTFTKNYYFVMDDNRDHPHDSRILGYIPEDHITGKVIKVLWSPARKQLLKKTR